MQPTKTEAIKRFLEAKTHSDLALMYNMHMECQVNVARDGGDRVQGNYEGRNWLAWTNGLETWKSFRIPRNANTTPIFEDSPMNFDLEAHAEGIGMTGWDWNACLSRWVAFDFDAISGHSQKHAKKLSDSDLENVKHVLTDIPWVTIRHSTSGKGLHVYVFLNPISTSNHTEHAAVARAVLHHMAGITGFDLQAKVDICGGNMWIWHRKMVGTNGLGLLKQGTEFLTAPPNWKDHLVVTRGTASKNKPSFLDQLNVSKDVFEQLCGQRNRTMLDQDHRNLIKFLETIGACFWFDYDHHMLVAHTHDLLKAHEQLKMRGDFQTISQGSSAGFDHNCFSGDTTFLTKNGIRSFKETVGTKQKLLVDAWGEMKWIEAEIKYFGQQKTYPLQFGDGSNCRVTANHNWHVLEKKNSIPTYALVPQKQRLKLAHRKLSKPSEEGIAHGFVFGDGWIKNTREKISSEVALFGQKEDMKNILAKFGNVGNQKYGDYYRIVVRQLPKEWKELPINPTEEYALGFILGLIAADGCVQDDVRLNQNNLDNMQKIREICMLCGLLPFQIQKQWIEGYKPGFSYSLSFRRFNLAKEHFIRPDQAEAFENSKRHLGMTVKSIDWSDELTEDVYCAVVPEHHNFTLSNGVVTGNCWLHPMPNGAWVVRRYGPGTGEAPTWSLDDRGYTHCYLNKELDFDTLCRVSDGVEHPKGGYIFQESKMAANVLNKMGADCKLPEHAGKRITLLKEHKEPGKLIMDMAAESSDKHVDFREWIRVKDGWQRVFKTKVSPESEDQTINCDGFVRHVINAEGVDEGWIVNVDGRWNNEPLAHVKAALHALDYKPSQVTQIVGMNICQPWQIVNKPFEPEYPGNREWNKKSAQLKFVPSPNREGLSYPTWQKILDHCGKSLTDAIQVNQWCIENGIRTGAEYLKIWIASVFKEPNEPLPYLFFYSKEQNTGKSSFHEALSRLMTAGYVRADYALVNQAGFNGELHGAIICAIEETDVAKQKGVYNRVKDWVTGRTISIHRKGDTPFIAQNTTHWIQTSNDKWACPIDFGDTRITMIQVDPLHPNALIAKTELEKLLDKEAPDFLADILGLEIPDSNDRLNLPVITTDDKRHAMDQKISALTRFLEANCKKVPGHYTIVEDFIARFLEYLDADEVKEWTKRRIFAEMPNDVLYGRLTQRQDNSRMAFGNISLEQEPVPNEWVYYLDVKFLKRRQTNGVGSSTRAPEGNREGHPSQIPVQPSEIEL